MRRAGSGAALLLVLWLLLLMAGLVAVFAFDARTEALQGSALRTQVAGRLAAEAGIEMAALRLSQSDPNARWFPDGRPNGFEFEGYRIEVRVQDEAAKFDLNAADVATLAELMRALGIEDARARQLAGTIQDWRDPDDLLALDQRLGRLAAQQSIAVFLHTLTDAPLERQILELAAAVYCGNAEIHARVRARRPDAIELWCPGMIRGTDRFDPVDLSVFTFGMAHKIRSEAYVKLHRLLDRSGVCRVASSPWKQPARLPDGARVPGPQL